MDRLIERFLRYVKVDTQSDHDSESFPSTEKQKDLSRILVKELKDMGLDAFLDDYGYVYAKINKNIESAPAIGFIAHVDTSPDAPGKDVNPRIIEKYDGGLIQLNDKLSMRPEEFPSLARVIGDDIIVTDGNTLLGADDKCGVAEIMELAAYYTTHKDVKHGDIYICFTPDEEIGKGANHFNYDWFKADFAYTADGSEVGGIEFENFNAATAEVSFVGKSIHPGSAKNKMINALHLAMEFHSMLPVFQNPAYTEKYEGFNHLTNLKGEVEHALSKYIIRNHSMEKFTAQKVDFETVRDYLNHKYGYEAVLLKITDSYFNMYEVIKNHMHIVELAEKAIENVGLVSFREAIRGGTDGARLTYEGLLCPNLGTGGYQFHGRLEFASINQMKKATEVFIEIVKLAAQKN
jgi:tripeptide aminopeptidase